MGLLMRLLRSIVRSLRVAENDAFHGIRLLSRRLLRTRLLGWVWDSVLF